MLVQKNSPKTFFGRTASTTKPSHAAARRHFRFQLSRFRIMSDTTLAVKSTMGTMRA